MRLRQWFNSVSRWSAIAGTALVISVTLAGCGGSGGVAEKQSTANGASQNNQTAAQQSAGGPAGAASQTGTEQSPESVVSEFLDGVRRGGSAADVGRLMSSRARQEYAAAGLVMQPLGAPDAVFEITRSVPYGDAGVLVNSLWTEKDETGQTLTYQVGWALKKEAAGWRVSGLILDDDPEPRIFNFESTEDVLALKQLQEAMEDPQDDAAGGTGDATRAADNSGFTMPPLR